MIPSKNMHDDTALRTLLEFVDKGFSDALKKRLTRVSQEVIALRIKRDGAKDETDKKQS